MAYKNQITYMLTQRINVHDHKALCQQRMTTQYNLRIYNKTILLLP